MTSPLHTSQNGWPASADPTEIDVQPLAIDGVAIGDGVRGGDVATVLGYVLTQIHRRVEPLIEGECWGYKYREIVGSVTLSNHASATAVDANAPQHPQGSRGTFTDEQVAEIHRILDEVEGVVRWGGDYDPPATVDEMHFELDDGPERVATVARQLGGIVTTLLDYSDGYPGGAAIAAAGHAGAARYLRKEGQSHVQPITPDEYVDLDGHRLAITLLYEHVRASRAGEGQAAGQHDARWALERAHELPIGHDNFAITFTVDYDAEPSAVGPYFQGCVDVLGVARVGCYGSYRVVEWLLDHGLITYAHQTAAWSHGERSARAHLYQEIGSVSVGGVSCDVNQVLRSNFGAVNQPEDDMSFSEEDRRMLFNLDAVNGAIAFQHPTVTLQVSDGATVTAQEFPTSLWQQSAVTVDAAALAAELVKAGVGGVTAQQLVEVLNGLRVTASQAPQA